MNEPKPHLRYRDLGFRSIREVPDDWTVAELGRIGTFSKGGGGTKEDETDEGFPCVRYGDLYTQHQFLLRDTRARISEESAARYAPIHYGDLLFAGSGETLEEIGKSAANLITGPAYCGGDIILFRPSVEIDATFPGYAADSAPAVHQKSCMGRGVTVMHIYASELKHLRLLLPPLDEQRDIAAFLDRETARIDSLIAKKRLLIERLQEYRTALITRTVTRGFPPEAARAAGLDPSLRLKASGVEWLGDVPEHWDVRSLRRLVSLQSGATPSKSRDDFWDGDIPWVSPKDMKRAELSDAKDHITAVAVKETSVSILPLETVLVVVRGMILAHSFPVAITRAPVTINQDMKALRVQSSLGQRYLYWALVGFGGRW